MQCLQCRGALDSFFVSGGTDSNCPRCGIRYLSVAHLMAKSDRQIVRKFWEYVLAYDWPTGRPCPHCSQPLSKIPLHHNGKIEPVLGCKHCYHLALKDVTMANFEQENSERKTASLAARRLEQSLQPDPIQELAARIAKASSTRWQIRISSEGGTEQVIGFTLGGIVGIFAIWYFLIQTGTSFGWAALAAGGAFGFGMHIALLKAKKEAHIKKEAPRVVREFSSQASIVPRARGAVRKAS